MLLDYDTVFKKISETTKYETRFVIEQHKDWRGDNTIRIRPIELDELVRRKSPINTLIGNIPNLDIGSFIESSYKESNQYVMTIEVNRTLKTLNNHYATTLLGIMRRVWDQYKPTTIKRTKYREVVNHLEQYFFFRNYSNYHFNDVELKSKFDRNVKLLNYLMINLKMERPDINMSQLDYNNAYIEPNSKVLVQLLNSILK